MANVPEDHDQAEAEGLAALRPDELAADDLQALREAVPSKCPSELSRLLDDEPDDFARRLQELKGSIDRDLDLDI